MIYIVLFLILSFVALCNGDSSGFKLIGRIILYIGVFIGAAYIIIHAPWLMLLFVVGGIIWVITSSKK